MERKGGKAQEERLRIRKWKSSCFIRLLRKLAQRNSFYQSLKSRKWQCIFQRMMSFKASKGWYNNFKKRYALEIKMKEKLNNPEMQGEFNIEVK